MDLSVCINCSAPVKRNETGSLQRLLNSPPSNGMASGSTWSNNVQSRCQGMGWAPRVSRKSSMDASVSAGGLVHIALPATWAVVSAWLGACAMVAWLAASAMENQTGCRFWKRPEISSMALSNPARLPVARYKSNKAAAHEIATSGATCSDRKASSKPLSAPASSPLAKRIAASSSSGSVAISSESIANRLDAENP